MKISQYNQLTTLSASDLFLTETQTGTKTIPASHLATALRDQMDTNERLEGLDFTKVTNFAKDWLSSSQRFLIGDGSEVSTLICDSMVLPRILDTGGAYVYGKYGIFRGRNLGDHVTDEQWAEIKAGTFRGLMLGDYWVIDGHSYVIADFDYWYRLGNSSVNNNVHHLVIFNSDHYSEWNKPMNDTVTTNGAYVGSKMFTDTLPNIVLPELQRVFGSQHIYGRKIVLNNAVDGSGRPSGSVEVLSYVDIPSESMYFGFKNQGPKVTADENADITDWRQLKYFTSNSRWVPRVTCWFREVARNGRFAALSNSGFSMNINANNNAVVCPVFAIYQS